MLEFPLYKQLKDCLVKDYNIKNICSKINLMEQGELEIIQALIFMYYLSNGGSMDSTKFKLPYNGRPIVGGKGCYYTFETLPKDLQDIIATYVN